MNKKLLNSFVEYYCPHVTCNEKLIFQIIDLGLLLFQTKCFYCKKHGAWYDSRVIYSMNIHHPYLNIERLNQLKEYYDEQKTAE
jgi:hypothetical protein